MPSLLVSKPFCKTLYQLLHLTKIVLIQAFWGKCILGLNAFKHYKTKLLPCYNSALYLFCSPHPSWFFLVSQLTGTEESLLDIY